MFQLSAAILFLSSACASYKHTCIHTQQSGAAHTSPGGSDSALPSGYVVAEDSDDETTPEEPAVTATPTQ